MAPKVAVYRAAVCEERSDTVVPAPFAVPRRLAPHYRLRAGTHMRSGPWWPRDLELPCAAVHSMELCASGMGAMETAVGDCPETIPRAEPGCDLGGSRRPTWPSLPPALHGPVWTSTKLETRRSVFLVCYVQ